MTSLASKPFISTMPTIFSKYLLFAAAAVSEKACLRLK